MPNSKVDSDYSFSPEQWVISLINTKGGTGGVIGGHAKIIVEGMRQRPAAGHFQSAPELCVAEFHIFEESGALDSGYTWVPQFLKNTRSNYAVLTSNRYNLKMVTSEEWESIVAPDIGAFVVRQAEHSLEYKVLRDTVTYSGVISDADLGFEVGQMIQMVQDNGIDSLKMLLLGVTEIRGHTQTTDENDVFRPGYSEGKELQYSQSSSKSWPVTPHAAMTMISDILDEKNCLGEYAGRVKQFQYAGMWCIYSYQGGHNCTTWAEEKLGKAGVGSGRLPTDSSKAMPKVHVNCNIS